MNKNNFSELFNKYRLKAQFETLSQLGEALSQEGIIYEDSIFSRWKNGSRIPQKRIVIITLIKVFIKYNSIHSLDQANELLSAASMPALTYKESTELFKPIHVYKTLLQENTELTEIDAFFLAKKILGLPFVMQNEEKIKKIYTMYKKNISEIIHILQKIENDPKLIENYANQNQKNELVLKEKINVNSYTELLKKLRLVRISDKKYNLDFTHQAHIF